MFAEVLNGWPKDIHGDRLRDGDIVAEGIVGNVLWDGRAELVARPIGIFQVKSSGAVHMDDVPDRNDFYDVFPIRTGKVQIKDDDMRRSFVSTDTDLVEIYLTRYDGRFYAWNNLEIIGNIYDDFI